MFHSQINRWGRLTIWERFRTICRNSYRNKLKSKAVISLAIESWFSEINNFRHYRSPPIDYPPLDTIDHKSKIRSPFHPVRWIVVSLENFPLVVVLKNLNSALKEFDPFEANSIVPLRYIKGIRFEHEICLLLDVNSRSPSNPEFLDKGVYASGRVRVSLQQVWEIFILSWAFLSFSRKFPPLSQPHFHTKQSPPHLRLKTYVFYCISSVCLPGYTHELFFW